ncbi:hypothetical protein Hanom_Chr03g00180151 [Helianthus anomalus]
MNNPFFLNKCKDSIMFSKNIVKKNFLQTLCVIKRFFFFLINKLYLFIYTILNMKVVGFYTTDTPTFTLCHNHLFYFEFP